MDSAPYKDHIKPPELRQRSQSPHIAAIVPRRKYQRRGTGEHERNPGQVSEDDDRSIMSDDSEHELDAMDSDAEIDAEAGLPDEERRKYIRRQRRRNQLAARIGGSSGGLSSDEAKEADKDVMRKLVFNAVLIGLWYFFSLSISIYNKWMFSSDHLDFHFPLFTTSLHMAVQFIFASLILLIFPSFRPSVPQTVDGKPGRPLVTPLFYFTRLVPCGTTTSLDIGLGNTSLRYITLTFYTMCKSSVLIFVLGFAFLFRLEAPSVKLILIILTMTLGVVMMVFGETAFELLGFILAISASFFSGFRWALTQILLLRHPATCNPFATMFFLAPIMFTTLFVISLFSEGPKNIVSGLYMLAGNLGTFKAVGLMFVPGFLAFCMIASEFTLLQRTNVVTLSICGIFKEVVTISAAGIIFHDELSVVNVSGLLVTIASIATYNYMKITKMRAEAREKLSKKDDDGEDRARSRKRRSSNTADDEAGDTADASRPLMDGSEDRRAVSSSRSASEALESQRVQR